MRFCILLSAFCLLTSPVARGQWLETTIGLPDSLGGVGNPWVACYVPPSNCVYVCADDGVMVVDCSTNARVARLDLTESMSAAFDSRDNKLYLACGSRQESLAVIDAVSHRIISRVLVGRYIVRTCYNPTANKVYCLAGSDSDTLVVVDCGGDSVLARLCVGYNEWYDRSGLCCNPAGNKVYCTSWDSEAVAVVDGAGDSLLRFVYVGEGPSSLVYSPVSNKVYCSDYYDDDVAIIDAGPDTLLGWRMVGGEPATLGYNPQANKVYVWARDEYVVDIIDCYGDTLLDPDGVELEDVEDVVTFLFDSADNRVFCVGQYYECIPAICGRGDTLVGQVELEGYGEYPDAACYSPAENRCYFVSEDWPDLVVVDPVSCAVEARVQLSCEPSTVCACPTHDKLYVLDDEGGTVAVIDCATNRVLGLIATPAYRLQLPVYAPSSDKLYCSGLQGNGYVLLAIDCAADSVVATVAMTAPATALLHNPVADKVYWSNYNYSAPSSVTVVDCRTDSVVAAVAVGEDPRALALNPDSNRVYCASLRPDTVPGDSLMISAIDGGGDTAISSVCAQVTSYYGQASLCYVPSVDVVCCTTNDTAVVVVDGGARQFLGPLPVGRYPTELLINPVSDKLYCLIPFADDVAVIDCGTMGLDRRIRVANGPAALGLDSIANRLYVLHPAGGCVSVIDGRTSRFLGLVEAGERPTALAWVPQHRRMYIADPYAHAVVVLTDSAVTGLADGPSAGALPAAATIVRSVLLLPGSSSVAGASLFDLSGREILRLQPGPNDVRSLPAGVYFVRKRGPGGQEYEGSSRKIVIQR